MISGKLHTLYDQYHYIEKHYNDHLDEYIESHGMDKFVMDTRNMKRINNNNVFGPLNERETHIDVIIDLRRYYHKLSCIYANQQRDIIYDSLTNDKLELVYINTCWTIDEIKSMFICYADYELIGFITLL